MKGIFIKKNNNKFVDPQFVSSTMDSFRLSWPDICLTRTGFSYMYRQWHSSFSQIFSLPSRARFSLN